jgi:heptose-I-phosphate ethanolaminephosphotransferase
MKTLKDSALSYWIVVAALLVLSLYVGGMRSRWFAVYVALSVSAVFAVLGYLRRYRYVVFIPIALILGLEVGYRFYFDERISIGVLQSVFDADSQDAVSMMMATWPLFVIAIVTAVVLFFLFRLLNEKSKKTGLRVLVTVIIINGTLFSANAVVNAQYLSDIKAYPFYFGSEYYKGSNLLLGDVVALATYRATERQYTTTKPKVLNASITGKTEGIPLVVLIMGESSFPGRYELYGYDKPTTPELMKLTAASNGGSDFCVLQKVHSLAPITRDSIAMTLSFETPKRLDPLFSEKSVIDLANENHYATYWVTSQRLGGRYNRKYGFLAEKSNHVISTHKEDNRLPVELKKIIDSAQPDKRLFIVLQMIGSHQGYADKFDPIDREALPNEDDYDRSIHKSDRVLGEIFKLLQSSGKKYAALFVSDHGEIVGKGHGLMDGGPNQFKIPFIYDSNVAGGGGGCHVRT